MSDIVRQTISLAEWEPCGVRGGTLVVLFSSNPPVRLQLDPTMVPTYELTLILHPASDLGTKIFNFMRKLRGKRSKIVLDRHFSIKKKKLYLVNRI